MSLTTDGMTPADIAAVTGNGNGFGFGGDGFLAMLILFLICGGAWGGNGFGGGNAIPWMMTNNSDVQSQIADSRFDTVQAITNTGYALNNTMMQNEMARQQCCCDTKQAIADLKYTIATENCADRAAIGEGVRDIIASQTASTQAILDKLCQQEIEALKTQNANLQTQLNMAALNASQTAQTAKLENNSTLQTAYLLNYLAPRPVPAYVVPAPGAEATPA